MHDTDPKPLLPIHVILGTGVYARIKTDAQPHIGNLKEAFLQFQIREADRDALWFHWNKQNIQKLKH